MPRKPREKSSTGIYHVMLRGINGQVIFEEMKTLKNSFKPLESLRK